MVRRHSNSNSMHFHKISGNAGGDGFPGRAGIQGPKGAPGDYGLDGLQGITGEAGSSFDGPKGYVGDAGYQGAPGSPGLDGLIGLEGERGEEGFQGERGEPGFSYRGSKGLRGEVGYAGFDGIAGLDGSRGDVGEIGNDVLSQLMKSFKSKIVFQDLLESVARRENVARWVTLDQKEETDSKVLSGLRASRVFPINRTCFSDQKTVMMDRVVKKVSKETRASKDDPA